MKIEFNVGDKLECRRNVYLFMGKKHILLIKNKSYEIINKEYVSEKYGSIKYQVMSEDRIMDFYAKKSKYVDELFETFYSQIEMRKYKLQKINGHKI